MPEYAITPDTSTKHTGRASGSLRSVAPNPRGVGTLMQSFQEDAHLGKRLKLSAFIKADIANGWAGLWMRVDGPNDRRTKAFDNMQDRPMSLPAPPRHTVRIWA